LDLETYYLNYSNEYIMCDQYPGNWCGDAHDYWNEYKSYYGIPIKNISNWISFNNSNDWGTLLNLAAPWGMNPIWIYANDSFVNDSYFQSFANTAWETGWLSEYEVQYTVYWDCVGSCTVCNYPNEGNWTVQNIVYGPYQYINY
jgi:hypothetical protein